MSGFWQAVLYLHLLAMAFFLGGQLVFPLAREMLARQIPIVFSTGGSAGGLPLEWAQHPILPKPLNTGTLTATLGALGLD